MHNDVITFNFCHMTLARYASCCFLLRIILFCSFFCLYFGQSCQNDLCEHKKMIRKLSTILVLFSIEWIFNIWNDCGKEIIRQSTCSFILSATTKAYNIYRQNTNITHWQRFHCKNMKLTFHLHFIRIDQRNNVDVNVWV